MPELKQLRVLRAVVDAGSFSAAADRLDYTQPLARPWSTGVPGRCG